MRFRSALRVPSETVPRRAFGGWPPWSPAPLCRARPRAITADHEAAVSRGTTKRSNTRERCRQGEREAAHCSSGKGGRCRPCGVDSSAASCRIAVQTQQLLEACWCIRHAGGQERARGGYRMNERWSTRVSTRVALSTSTKSGQTTAAFSICRYTPSTLRRSCAPQTTNSCQRPAAEVSGRAGGWARRRRWHLVSSECDQSNCNVGAARHPSHRRRRGSSRCSLSCRPAAFWRRRAAVTCKTARVSDY